MTILFILLLIGVAGMLHQIGWLHLTYTGVTKPLAHFGFLGFNIAIHRPDEPAPPEPPARDA